MPQVIQTIPDDELKTDYHDAKLDAETIGKLFHCGAFGANSDGWRTRMETNKTIMRNIEAEASRRGLTL